ncbi:S1 RNA-binding domain-containing protein [Streptomyces sp. DSM 42041]|uniref:S1 RNA-binding domain-containing protein n=1 Tax=Streptomyces hazeniae TaxID=3075538 RepID=A0ABU2NRT6_9ACTN|nr:S1 RNA-binding domain-containing protein [Streptomyces sp. DSM 42041]MDT0379459.1 S1 RNA-binding domain-containing protein [Streptomyces sp. DSM 42041]
MSNANGRVDVQAGDVRKGIVTGLRDFGVFVDLGEVEGIIDLLEVSWRRDVDASQLLCVGQEVFVLVLGTETSHGPVRLSLRALVPDPLVQIAREMMGTTVSARVSQTTPIGVFVEVSDGIHGLLLSQGSKEAVPSLRVGDRVDVQVDGVNLQKRQMSLSLVNAHPRED